MPALPPEEYVEGRSAFVEKEAEFQRPVNDRAQARIYCATRLMISS
jgi:hypothetical protein